MTNAAVGRYLAHLFASDPTLSAALGPTPLRLYPSVAPEGVASPYGVYSFPASVPVSRNDGAEIFAWVTVLVKIMGKNTGFSSLDPLMTQANNVLRTAGRAVYNGHYIGGFIPQGDYTFTDAVNRDIFYHLGRYYRLMVHEAS